MNRIRMTTSAKKLAGHGLDSFSMLQVWNVVPDAQLAFPR
jgi:hypothetical protein